MRNKFSQLMLNSFGKYLHQTCWAINNPKVDALSLELHSGHYDCKADTLPHDHRHRVFQKLHVDNNTTKTKENKLLLFQMPDLPAPPKTMCVGAGSCRFLL